MLDQPETNRNALQNLIEHLREYRIACIGLGLLFLMGFCAVTLARHLNPELTLRNALLPSVSHIIIMRIFGTITALGFLVYVQIIHARQMRTKQQLAEAEQRYRGLFMLSPDPLCILDKDTRIRMANERAAVLCGFPSERDLVGRTGMDLMDPRDRPRLQDQLERALNGEPIDGFQAHLVRQDGAIVDIELNAARIHDSQTGTDCILAIFRDVTERKKLEAMILEISERERLRVGIDLHDGVCSELAGIAYLAQGLHERLLEENAEMAKDSQEIWILLKDTIDQARSLARGLAPASVMNGGLSRSIEELCEISQSRSGVECNFHSNENVLPKDSSAALHVYRIAQEAVNNALSHAHPRSIQVELLKAQDRIKLTVTDDGLGFRNSHPKEGMGIAIMRYRANLLGGTFNIGKNKDSSGTSIVCSFPPPE